MFKIDTPNAVNGEFVASDQVTGTEATNFSADFANAEMNEIVNAIEAQGIILNKSDNTQLSQAINAVAGRKRNLNYNPAFFVITRWGGTSIFTTPIAVATKLDSVGWYISASSTITTSGNLSIYSSPNGLTISGTISSSGGTINIYQKESKLQDTVFGNNTQATAGEVKKFTSSIKYKKVSGPNFTIQSFINSIAGSETIILDETKETSVDGNINTAYRHAQVNTRDLVYTPIEGCGFQITLAGTGAFEIQLKNCDLTEGFTIPDFQTYGDSVADKAWALTEYGPDSLSETYFALAPVQNGLGSTSGESIITIPLQTKNVSDSDILVTTIDSVAIYDSFTGLIIATNTEALTSYISSGVAVASYAFNYDAPPTNPAVCRIRFNYIYTKA